jgi:SAM-dependent methyltransferase
MAGELTPPVLARSDLPFPPIEMRELVGQTDLIAYDNPSGDLVYPSIPGERYDSVFDFGCGCGRVARQLIQQDRRPTRYVGVDLHKGMVEWFERNLAGATEGFEFFHHDVYNIWFNPSGVQPAVMPFPVGDHEFTMVHAISVFTHLVEMQTEHYFREVARVLRADGVFLSTWFLFDRSNFPFLPDSHNALYVDYIDPTAAVLYDRVWVQDLATRNGLAITLVEPPKVRGHQWTLLMESASINVNLAQWPEDDAPIGKTVPPPGGSDAYLIR